MLLLQQAFKGNKRVCRRLREGHPGQKCGNRFRAKVANAFKGKKLSIAEENLAIARFKEEIEDANLDEELYKIANVEKGYADSILG